MEFGGRNRFEEDEGYGRHSRRASSFRDCQRAEGLRARSKKLLGGVEIGRREVRSGRRAETEGGFGGHLVPVEGVGPSRGDAGAKHRRASEVRPWSLGQLVKPTSRAMTSCAWASVGTWRRVSAVDGGESERAREDLRAFTARSKALARLRRYARSWARNGGRWRVWSDMVGPAFVRIARERDQLCLCPLGAGRKRSKEFLGTGGRALPRTGRNRNGAIKCYRKRGEVREKPETKTVTRNGGADPFRQSSAGNLVIFGLKVHRWERSPLTLALSPEYRGRGYRPGANVRGAFFRCAVR